jgi:hypothetical protein
MSELEKYLTYADVANKLSRSTNTIRRWASENYMAFPSASYLGRTAVFKEATIAAWVKNTLSPLAPMSTKGKRSNVDKTGLGNE